jgi:GTPase
MMVEVREALEGCDLVLVIMDVTRKFDPRDQFALDLLRRPKTKAFLILNKVDLIREKSKLLPLIEQYRKLYDFAEVVPISALKRNGLDALLEMVIATLPAGPAYFPEDQVTDQPARFMAAEIIREQLLLNTSEEIPYATTVMVENFEEGARLTRIAATIYCEREGQKGILVGKGGLMLKKIGTSARLQIERMLGTKVFLELYVKAEPRMARFTPLRRRTRLAPSTGTENVRTWTPQHSGTEPSAREDRNEDRQEDSKEEPVAHAGRIANGDDDPTKD